MGGGQKLPHIGGEQEVRKRGYKSIRKQHPRKNFFLGCENCE